LGVTLSVRLFRGFAALLSIAAACASDSANGREIYLRGQGSGKVPVRAAIGDGDTIVPGTLMPCANCHGTDGLGKPEAGVTPPSIRWNDLTKPYEVTEANGRKHLPYDEALLRRAIGMGIDSAGNRLSDTMPRFQMERTQIDDLISYLKVIGAPDPGLTDSSIRLGVLLPPPGSLAAFGDAVKQVLTAYFDDVNRSGGVYGRRIELKFGEAPSNLAGFEPALRGFLEESDPAFALAGSYFAGRESEASRVLRQDGVPTVGVFALYPQLDFPVNPYIFYLDAGVRGEAEALAGYAESGHGKPAGMVVYDGDSARRVAEAVSGAARRMKWTLMSAGADPGTEWANDGAILFLCPAAAIERLIAVSIAKGGSNLSFLIPGSLASPALLSAPASLGGRAVFAFSNASAARPPQAMAQYQRLAARHHLDNQNLTARLTALADARIVHAALVRAGRELSRDKLVEALEGMYEVEAGLALPVSFGPNRRVGIPGAKIVIPDAKTGERR
jgi:ABC-type branched-subunit amino acid transport system substrate-binding protein